MALSFGVPPARIELATCGLAVPRSIIELRGHLSFRGLSSYNPNKVSDLLESFHKAISYSGLKFGVDGKPEHEQDNELENEQDDEQNEKKDKMINDPKEMPRHIDLPKPQSVQMLLTSQNKAMLTIEKTPISKDDFERIKQWIDLMEVPLTEKLSETS